MIKVQNLAKVFGTKRAVDGVSFSVNRGEVLGFLGPNGAGKSTTMRMITGFLPPSGGSVSVGGFDIVEQLEREFGLQSYPVTWPVGSGDRFCGIYHRHTNKVG